MYLRSDERRPQMTTGFALRVAVLGGISVALFAVIFFRLWFLQVLSGDEYLAEANNNRTREVRVLPPRGEILDRDGELLVSNRTSLALQVDVEELPSDLRQRRLELARIGRLIGLSLTEIRHTMREELIVDRTSPVTLKSNVPHELVYYFAENGDRFPGVTVEPVFVRRYPQGTLAAHLFGTVGEINPGQLRQARNRGIEPGFIIGQDGVEYSYDQFLRGTAGSTRIQVDSLGNTLGELNRVEPEPGDNLRLTIDSDVQAAGEAALGGTGLYGGFVAMDVDDGAIIGMGSTPSFDPADLIEPTQAEVETLYQDESAPLLNRAIAGLYPTGSTFKPITSVAALASGAVTPEEIIYDDGAFDLGGGNIIGNAGGAAYGSIAMEYALQVSSDVYYYTLGDRMSDGQALQRWARRLGIGRETGIDLPSEAEGLLPTPRWRERLYRQDLTDRPWSSGDNVNLSVGQGDLQANPLQMAVAYATIANGGEVPTPHVGLRIEDAAGRLVQEVAPPPARTIPIDPVWRNVILDGLHAAAQSPGGTSYNVFGGFDVPVAGKTGTAERPPYGDQSWYVVLAPYPNPEIVVAVTAEQGGFGADTAAPIAATILSEYFGGVDADPVGGASAPD